MILPVWRSLLAFDHDVFLSYAHGDDGDWINRFLDRLRPVLSRLLPGATVWIDRTIFGNPPISSRIFQRISNRPRC